MKNPLRFLLITFLMISIAEISSAKNPIKSSFKPCPVNASPGKRPEVRMTTIRKKGKPAHKKKTQTVTQKTVKTKTVKQKQQKVKKSKQRSVKMKQTSKSISRSKKSRSIPPRFLE